MRNKGEENKDVKRYFYIESIPLLSLLIHKGYRPINRYPSIQNNKTYELTFDKTPELERIIDSYKKGSRDNKENLIFPNDYEDARRLTLRYLKDF